MDACRKECIQAIVRPFGAAKILFADKLGGNVTTIHNVRSEEYRASDNTAWNATDEKEKYEKQMAEYAGKKIAYKNYVKAQQEYKKWEDGGCVGDAPVKPTPVQDPKYKYRDGNKDYAKVKKEYGEKKESGELNDPFGNENFAKDDCVHVDHAHSCEKVATDPARVLAEMDGPALANIPENHNPMLGNINNSKNDLTAQEAIARWKSKEAKRLKDIDTLKTMQEEGVIDKEQLARLRRLQKLQNVNKNKVIEAEKKAKKAIDKKIAADYYTGKKFLDNVSKAGVSEGRRMGLQQSIGLLMEEFVHACFDEVKDVWRNGFKGGVDATFLAALKERFLRVAQRVQSRWKDALHAFKDGFISGFFSNLVTVIINMFVTTSARIVRVVREGFMSLYRALKMLAFPPEGMSSAQAADAASKLLATGIITGGSIIIEQAIENSLQFLGVLAPYVSAISVGLVTGLCTVFAVYMLDKVDIFCARAETEREKIVAKLNDMVAESYDNALKAAEVFEGPALLHLK